MSCLEIQINQRSSNMKPKGFTLIELLVVLTIGMILTSLLGGVGVDMVKKTQRQQDVNQVKSQIQQASYQAYLCGCRTELKLGAHSAQIQSEGVTLGMLELPNILLNKQIIVFQSTGLPSESTITYWTQWGGELEEAANDNSRTLDIMRVIESER